MKLKLAFSPCPNDTFIFDAMVNNKVDTEGLSFDLKIVDVESLNKEIINQEVDITKLSFHAYAYVADKYLILDSGSALGNNNGPVMVSKYKIYPDELNSMKIAIPGKYTTANLILSIAFPKATDKVESLFSDVEEMVLRGDADAGLLIHEKRFTYAARGLRKVIDLGEWWEKKTQLSTPLGGIAINRNISEEVQRKVNRVLQRSIEYAIANPLSAVPFIKTHSQIKDEDIIFRHIELFVNDYTVKLGEDGKDSIRQLFELGAQNKIIPAITQEIFLKPIKEETNQEL